MQQIAQHILESASNQENLVLVTVVRRVGSTPRGIGSQMLVSENGLVCGTIGGGAIEGRGIDQAKQLLSSRKNQMEDISLSVACGGDATLLYSFIDAADSTWSSVMELVQEHFATRKMACLLLQCPNADDAQMRSGVALLDEAGTVIVGDQSLVHPGFKAPAAASLAEDVFALPLSLPYRAVIFGAGHVAHAVVPALSTVGFACTVCDCRPELATAERFPQAQHVVCASYANITETLPLEPRDYVLLMTHSHETDYLLLEQVLQEKVAYVGFMGSRKKIATARKHCLERGISEEALDSVHWPIGLDIKAETPAEIAISVAAECILHRATQQ